MGVNRVPSTKVTHRLWHGCGTESTWSAVAELFDYGGLQVV